MATWDEVRNFLASKATIANEGPGWLLLKLATDDNRSQVVEVQYRAAADPLPALISVWSTIGLAGEVDLARLMEITSHLPVTVGSTLSPTNELQIAVAHYTPADTIDELELDHAVGFVTYMADCLENALPGGDRF